MDIAELEKRHKEQVNAIFILMLEIAFVFAIPAIIAVLLGKRLDNDQVGIITAVLVGVAFIVSWIIVALLYRRHTKALTKTEDEIKRLKQQK